MNLYHYKGRVAKVTDGDTLHVLVDYGFKEYGMKIFRLYDIDTPEIYRPHNDAELDHGREAKKFVEDLLLGKDIEFRSIKDKTGKYGRYLAEIFLTQEMQNELGAKGFATGSTIAEALNLNDLAKKTDEEYEKILNGGS